MVFIKEAISKVVGCANLSGAEAALAMEEIMDGVATPSQIAAFLTAMRMKGTTVDEFAAFAESMKKHAFHIRPLVLSSRLLDTCGTGGDKLRTFNISTISAIVTSGAGVPIAKHGNRSFASKCGSADLLERLGVNINADPASVQASIEQAGIGFMFAPIFHPAMNHAGVPRKEIGIRTMFNVLGPLTNPADAKAQLVGVYDDSLVLIIAEVLRKLGVEDAIVVHGLDGIDEISLIGKTHVARVRASENEISEETLTPECSFGFKQKTCEEISAEGDIETYALTALRILSCADRELSFKEMATKEMVLMNSSAALVTSGRAGDYLEGVEQARSAIESGSALDKLNLLVKYSRGDSSKIESLLQIKGA